MGIRDKLAMLRERRVETFGSKQHGYVLAPPLDETTVRSLEAKHGITLPASYRSFLVNVGAHGAGPYYGLVDPSRWGHALYGDVAMPDFAARPCAYTVGGANELDRDMAEPLQGAIVIAEQGCAYYAMLVVTGEARGRILYANMDCGAPYFTDDVDFTAWYERWVDELLAGFKHSWFGSQMPGTPETFAAIARDANHPRRGDALHAMRQLPELNDKAREAVALRVRDRDPKVRHAALSLVKHFALGDSIRDHLRHALDDADPKVRAIALSALVASSPHWHDDARRQLTDNDAAVVSEAARELGNAKAMTETEVLAMFASPLADVRVTACEMAREIPSARVFDRVAEQLRAHGDTRWNAYLLALIAQARIGVLDEPRRETVFDVLQARIAAAVGSDPPSAALHGLRVLAAGTDSVAVRAFATLVELTRHPEAFIRFEVAQQLGDLGNRDALPALRELATDTAMPRATGRSTAWSVGANAKHAIVKLES